MNWNTQRKTMITTFQPVSLRFTEGEFDSYSEWSYYSSISD